MALSGCLGPETVIAAMLDIKAVNGVVMRTVKILYLNVLLTRMFFPHHWQCWLSFFHIAPRWVPLLLVGTLFLQSKGPTSMKGSYWLYHVYIAVQGGWVNGKSCNEWSYDTSYGDGVYKFYLAPAQCLMCSMVIVPLMSVKGVVLSIWGLFAIQPSSAQPIPTKKNHPPPTTMFFNEPLPPPYVLYVWSLSQGKSFGALNDCTELQYSVSAGWLPLCQLLPGM